MHIRQVTDGLMCICFAAPQRCGLGLVPFMLAKFSKIAAAADRINCLVGWSRARRRPQGDDTSAVCVLIDLVSGLHNSGSWNIVLWALQHFRLQCRCLARNKRIARSVPPYKFYAVVHLIA